MNTLGIPQAHPAPVKRKGPISYMLYLVELKSLFFFSEKGSIFRGFPKEIEVTHYSTTTELPAPMASFLFPKTHTHISLFTEVENTNCHTTPNSSIPVDTDYSNRFELCTEGYTLPTSPALRSHGQ
jgi:hypothetical protein